MLEFPSEELRRIMDKKNNIRNISVIAHLGHGKSTLTNSLATAAGITAHEVASDDIMFDTRADEATVGKTIKSTGISLLYEMTDASLKAYKDERDGDKYLINLIDSPGHVDFSSEVTVALRVTDGALLVVDCIEGVCVQTKIVLQQALRERIRPVLTVNKIDKCFLELQEGDKGLVLDPDYHETRGEKAYQIFNRVIEDANAVMATYKDPSLGEVHFCPKKGTASFSAGLHGWGFTLNSFAKMLAAKYESDESKFMELLWGENYYDKTTKTWTTKSTGSSKCVRGFVYLCYVPLMTIIGLCMNSQKDSLWPKLNQLGVSMNRADKDLTGEALMKRVMQTWLPADAALLEMMIFHLPNPASAQKYRVENLYEGPLDDICATAIRNCDPGGPLMLYVSKMIPTSDKAKFFAFGRVFSGRIAAGMTVRVMGLNYVPGQEKHMSVDRVHRTFIWTGSRNKISFADIPSGNIVIMVVLDTVITRNATLTDIKEIDACPIRGMKFFASPVVRVGINCNVGSDIPKLVEGLKRLEMTDHMVLCTREGHNQFTVAGAGELHLKFCLKDLKERFIDGAKVSTSSFVASFRETVLESSCRTVKSRSRNSHNYIHMVARPMDEGLLKAMNDGRIGPSNHLKMRSKILSEEFNWDKDLADKICCVGPRSTGTNVIVDMCRVKCPNEVKEDMLAGFQEALQCGVLAGESMHGICFDLHDAVFHADAKYRRPDHQIIPTAKNVVYGSVLAAKPRLLEPVYVVEIQAPQAALVDIYGVLNQKGARVFDKIHRQDTELYNIKAYLPVSESFGIEEMLLTATSGKALSQCVFDHWDKMSSDPLVVGSQAALKVLELRKLKGMMENIPALSYFEHSS